MRLRPTQIDVKDTLRKKLNVDFRPYIILGACNPTLAHSALTVDPQIGLLLPCNVVVQAAPEGGVVVSIADPRAMFTIVSNPKLTPVGGRIVWTVHHALRTRAMFWGIGGGAALLVAYVSILALANSLEDAIADFERLSPPRSYQPRSNDGEVSTHSGDLAELNLASAMALEAEGKTYRPVSATLAGHHASGPVTFALARTPDSFGVTAIKACDLMARRTGQ